MKWFIVCCAVVVCVLADCNEDFRMIDSIYSERPCLRQGGICTIANDCPQLTEKRGLCPEQRSRGVECCYGLSVKETRCGKRGGRCLTAGQFCGPSVRYDNATDCPKSSTCCILV